MPKKFVKEIYLTNYKKHQDFSAKIEGRHFVVSGPNGAGKSSIFQAIQRLLGNDLNKPDVAITRGQESGEIRQVLMADGKTYQVKEKYSKNGRSRVTLWRVGEDGRKDELTPAMTRIQEIFGNCVDLTPLADMTGDKQFEYLRKQFNIDISNHETSRDYALENRKLAKREAATLRAKMDDPENRVVTADLETYKEEVIIQDLLEQKIDMAPYLKKLADAQLTINKRKGMREDIETIDQQIEALQKNKLILQNQLNQILEPKVKEITAEKETKELENKVIDEKIVTAEEHNKWHRKVVLYNKYVKELEEKELQIETYNKEVKGKDDAIKNALKKIDLGLIYPGLELRYTRDEENGKILEQGLFLNELPFNRQQQSHGEIIRCLITLSTIINPDGLNFVWIPDWNLLDAKNQEEVINFAKEQENVQLGIEKVDNTLEIVTEFINME